MTDTLYILGGKALEGTLTVGGSKNGALPALAACLLFNGTSHITNVPQIQDVETMLALLDCAGAKVERDATGAVIITNNGLHSNHIPAELAAKMRASHYLLAPLVARMGEASLPMPGGCNLGSRPVDYILDALKPLGITADQQEDRIIIKAGDLRGGKVVLDPHYRSPGATFSVIMAACLAKGETVIENACTEPDVISLCEMLNRAGANIKGAGTYTLRIEGVNRLNGIEHKIPPDRLEAGTFLLAGAASRGDVTIKDVNRKYLRGFIERLEECGAEVKDTVLEIRVICKKRPAAINIITEPFPGFPTDLQPPMMAFLATAKGISRLVETIFDGRMAHAEELRKMGACIEVDGRKATIRGVPRLRGAEVEALNIRAGATLVVAAVAAEGETCLRGIAHLQRGYEKLEEKLLSLGAQVRQ